MKREGRIYASRFEGRGYDLPSVLGIQKELYRGRFSPKTQAVGNKIRVFGADLLREFVEPVSVDQRTRNRRLADRSSRSIVTSASGERAVTTHSMLGGVFAEVVESIGARGRD